MKILLAVDGSPCSEVAAQEVAQRHWPPGSTVKIVSVVEPPPLPQPSTLGVNNPYLLRLAALAQERAQATTKLAAGFIRQQQGAALTITGEIAPVSPPSQMILQLAETWGADMIVLGSHGQRGWKRDWLGSVSRIVAAQAPCSVTIVRCAPQVGYSTSPK